ncbi:MAG TPA: GNAT family protein [Candidatus Ozemobacteraceae bacterium]|nr:GNAT family protein [Candidatus Ozemobacteraceae bacterium]
MEIPLPHAVIRSYRPGDAAALAHHADNRKIWLNLRDRFPHPYTLADAVDFIEKATHATPETMFAICVGGEAAGGIGYTLHSHEQRLTAELGYWLGERFWGRGIMSEAVEALTSYAMKAHGLVRIYAMPYATNTSSARVLEKAGYVFEGRLRKNVIKDGRILDQLVYAKLADAAGDPPQ